MRQKKHEDLEPADYSSDLLLSHTLHRRAIAYELAELCPYETFAELAKKLMKEYMKPARSGYKKISMQQIEQADQIAYIKLAEYTAGGLTKTGADYPLAEAMKKVLVDSEFQYSLMQMPASTKGGEPKEEREQKPNKGKGKGSKGQKGSESGKSAGKGGKKRSTVTRTRKGVPICFGYQSKAGCKNVTKTEDGKERCERGAHCCWVAECEQDHPGHLHPK